MQPSSTILVSGFEKFGDDVLNPSELLANNLHGSVIGGCGVESVILPVTFADAFDVLAATIEEIRPAWVFCLGQAGGSDSIRIERVAVNICEAPIPDNAGCQPRGVAIQADGPLRLASSLPVAEIVTALMNGGILASVSDSAGTFVCNHVFYKLMDFLRGNPGVLGGFVHVPYLPEQTSLGASMPLEEMERGIALAIATALSVPCVPQARYASIRCTGQLPTDRREGSDDCSLRPRSRKKR